MNLDKIKGYINISRKAGYLIIGGEKLKNYRKKLYLIIYDESAQKNTLKIIEQYKDKEIISVKNLDEITSINNCKIIGIKNKMMSESISKLLKEGE